MFQITAIIDNMKYCTKCKLHKDIKDFSKSKTSTDRRQLWCKLCVKAYDARRFQKIKIERYQQVKSRRDELVAWVRKLKSQPCIDCQQSFHPVCIDFHHVDPKQKTSSIADMVRTGYGRKRILEEMDKCEAICSNCHRIRTFITG